MTSFFPVSYKFVTLKNDQIHYEVKRRRIRYKERSRVCVSTKTRASQEITFLTLHAIESLFSKFSDWPNLPGRAKCGRLWRRERMGICTWIWQCSHSCALSGKNSKCEESNECFQRAMNRCGVPSFLSFTIRACGIRRLLRHHLLPGWSLGQLQTLIFH